MEITSPSTPSPIASTPSPPNEPPPAGPEGPSFAEVFRAVGNRIDEGDRLMTQVGRARGSLDAAELLALQAAVYRYSEAVELAAKLVDRMSSAVKTTLQSQ